MYRIELSHESYDLTSYLKVDGGAVLVNHLFWADKFELKIASLERMKCSYKNNCMIRISLTHSSRSLNDRRSIKDDRATTFLHSSLSSAIRRVSPNPNPVQSDILSSHLFFCLPFLLPPCTVPCTVIFASPVDFVMWPYFINVSFITVVI